MLYPNSLEKCALMTIATTDSSHSRSSSEIYDDVQIDPENKKAAQPDEPASDASSGAQLTSREKSGPLSGNDDTWPTPGNLPAIDEHTPGVLKSRSENTPALAPLATTLTAAVTTTTTNTTATTVTSTTTNTRATTVTATVNPYSMSPVRRQTGDSSGITNTTDDDLRAVPGMLHRTPEARLIEAIKKEDIRGLLTLVDAHPALLNTVLKDPLQTPLAFAIESENRKAFGYLLTCKQIDINHPGTDGTTALHTAAAKGDLAALNLLLAAGAEPDTTDNMLVTPLISATAYNHTNIVQALLQHLKKSSQLNRQDRRGYTALAYAAVSGNATIARLLLNHGADPRLASCEKKSPLMYAIEHGHPEVVLVLWEFGVNIHKKTDTGATPLTCAAENADAELTKKLLRLGVEFPSNYGDPVIRAADNGHAIIIDLLHKHGYPIDKADPQGRTPLMRASNQGETETVNLLIALGADPDRTDNGGENALDLAVAIGSNKTLREKSHIEVIVTLLAHMKGPIKINEKTLKPLMALAVEHVSAHQDWGLLREILAKGLVDHTGNPLPVNPQAYGMTALPATH